MSDDDGAIFVAFVLLILLVLVLGWSHSAANSMGFNAGVRAGASGAWVVVDLPDGTTKAVKVKGNADGK